MSTPRDTRTRPLRPTYWSVWGFIVGAAVTLPATYVALLSPAGEAVHAYVVPGTVLLGPLSDTMATWPGLVNVAIGTGLNGLVYAAGAGALGTAVTVWRHR